MKLTEIFNSRQDLNWEKDGDDYRTNFYIDDREYGIVVQAEDHPKFKSCRVDFYFSDKEGQHHLEATGFNKDAGKILGIVGNGIKEKFRGAECIWFVAKKATSKSTAEHSARVKIYNRLMHKLGVELSMRRLHITIKDEDIFALCKNSEIENAFKDFV